MLQTAVTMEPADNTYQCPGEPYRISRSVHLGRLANFYPKCRECPHREDTGPLSSKTVRQLQRSQQCQPASSIFVADGIRGVYLNELTRKTAREFGNALGRFLASKQSADPSRATRQSSEGEGAHDAPPSRAQPRPWQAAGLRRQTGPVAVVGHDERLSSPDLTAGVIEGLRAAGCQVVGIGCAAGACLRYAVRYLEADGAVHVTGGAARPHVNGLRFYGRWAVPLTRDRGLDEITRLRARPTASQRRRVASLSHFHAEVPYHAGLLKFFHALRPLRVLVTEHTATIRQSIERLLSETPCTVTWAKPKPAEGDDANKTATVDVGVAVDGDDRITFFDECHRPVPTERACVLLGNACLRVQPRAAVVLAEPVPDRLAAAFEAAGARVHRCASDAADLYNHMNSHDAVYGVAGFGDSRDRLHYWFHEDGPVLDPVRALAAMLAALSTSDRPLSAVLPDLGAPAVP